jgi:hypothetical protein
MKEQKCSVCGKWTPSVMIGLDGRCDKCLKKDRWR